jgi:hypothetical protein
MPVTRHHEPGNYRGIRFYQFPEPMYSYSEILSTEKHAIEKIAVGVTGAA